MIGVLIALGSEQVVERLHHRSQVNAAVEKLRAESADNGRVIDYDLLQLQKSLAVVDRDLAALSGCSNLGAIRTQEPLPQDPVLTPVDVAWQGARDSALLPLMPELQVDNYAKVDGIMSGYATRISTFAATSTTPAGRWRAFAKEAGTLGYATRPCSSSTS